MDVLDDFDTFCDAVVDRMDHFFRLDLGLDRLSITIEQVRQHLVLVDGLWVRRASWV